jgi:hypothetical protein
MEGFSRLSREEYASSRRQQERDHMFPKDPEKMVLATAKAMALADVGAATPPVLREYIGDARKVLIDVLKAAKRQGWDVPDLLVALDPPKPKKMRGEAWAPPRLPA